MSKSKKAVVKSEVSNVVVQENAQIQTPILTVSQLQKAVSSANELYKTRKGITANIGKTGFNPDLQKAHKIVTGLSDAQLIAIGELDIADKLIQGLSDASNTKKPMRTLQAVMFALTGSGLFLKGSAKTFILEYCGLVTAKVKTRDGLAFCATGKGNQHTSDEVQTATARKLMKAFGVVAASSEQTQNSVSFSKGGIAETLGVAKKDSRTGLPIVNIDNKVTQKLNDILLKLTDNSIALLVAQSTGKE